MKKTYRPLYLFVVVVLALSGCAPTPAPVVPVETIVAATYAVIAAQTDAARPPDTPTPLPPTATRPPGTVTPTPTETFVISTVTPSFTPTSTLEPTATNITSGSGSALFACNILSVSPQNVYRVKANDSFRWTWNVENIGTTAWEPRIAEVAFISGTKLANKKNYPLPEPTQPGKNTTITIKMHAPGEPGTYTSTWGLRSGIHRFCYAKLEIEVYK